MKVLKHLFISLFPAFSGLIFFLGLYTLFSGNEPGIQIKGATLSGFTVAFFFGKLFIKPVARTEKNPPLYFLGILLGFASAIYYFFKDGVILDLILAGSILAGWFLYIYWYSVFEARGNNQKIVVGERLPDFPLETTEGKVIRSVDYFGSPAVLIFYRGNWCPLCMAQIKEIAGEYQELEKRGAKVLLISNQPHENSEALSKKFNVNFEFLVDKDNRAAELLNIAAQFGIPGGFQTLGYDSNTAMPTVIITNKKGEIIFADLTDNYRVRPEPSIFLKVLDKELAM